MAPKRANPAPGNKGRSTRSRVSDPAEQAPSPNPSAQSPNDDYDHELFVSAAAAEVHRRRSDLGFVIERGLQPSKKHNKNIFETIRHHKWEKFCAQPGKVNMPWVREFYANIKNGPPFEFYSKVRGRIICFADNDIRALFGLEYVEPDTTPISRDDLNALICPNGGKWNEKRGSIPTLKIGKKIPRSVKAWIYFVSATLKPTKDVRNASKDRLELVYRIMKHQQVDIGDIICRNIFQVRNNFSKSNLYPALITALCKRAEVASFPTDEEVTPQGAIDDATIHSYQVQQGPEAGEGGAVIEYAPARTRGATPTRMAALEQRQAAMEKQIAVIDTRHVAMETRQIEMQTKINWMAEMMGILLAQAGCSSASCVGPQQQSQQVEHDQTGPSGPSSSS